MITTKERSSLKAIAHEVKPLMQIGKLGVTDTVVSQASELLYNRELIKIKVQNNSDVTAKEIINELASRLDAEPVSAIGNMITLYKYSAKKDVEHIIF